MAEATVLVLVGAPEIGSSEVGLVESLASAGARVIAWQHPSIVQDRFPSPDVAAALGEQGIDAQTPTEALGPDSDFDIEEAVIAWMKAFGGAPLSDGRSFRELFRHGPLVLWWWAELYLYHDTPLRLLVRDVEVLGRLVERFEPQRIVLVRPVRDLAAVAEKLAAAVEVVGEAVPAPGSAWRTTWLYLKRFAEDVGHRPQVHRPIAAAPGDRKESSCLLSDARLDVEAEAQREFRGARAH